MKKYVFALLLSTLALTCYAPVNLEAYNFDFKEFQIDKLRNSELTLENVIEYVKLNNIQHPEVVIRQFILETGWGKSQVCKKYNNLFGFRNKNGYIKYSHWTESICSTVKNITGYKQFQNKKYKGGCYYTFLVNVGYAEAPDYVQILKTIKIKV